MLPVSTGYGSHIGPIWTSGKILDKWSPSYPDMEPLDIWDPYGVNHLGPIRVTAVFYVYLAIHIGPIWSSSDNFHICRIWKTSGKHLGNLGPIWTIWNICVGSGETYGLCGLPSGKYLDYLGNIWAILEISGLPHMYPMWRPWTKP